MKKHFIILLILIPILMKGQELKTSMIVAGRDAIDEEFKWMVELISSDEHLCGGVLIDPYWVLTAAHCGLGDPGGGVFPPDRVIVNNTELETVQSFSEEFFIDTIITFPGFDISTTEDSVFAKDIGLIRLKNASSFTPIDMNFSDSNIVALQDTVLTIGWGIASDTGEYLPNLRYAEPLVKAINPKKIYAGYDAGEDPAGSSAGDSGGPLFVTEDGVSTVIGVVSGNDEENSVVMPGSPARYTRVYAYKEWIQNTISSFEPVGLNEVENNSINITTVGSTVVFNQNGSQDKTINIRIMNSIGQILKSKSINLEGEEYIEDLSNLENGVYFIVSDDKAINHTFIR